MKNSMKKHVVITLAAMAVTVAGCTPKKVDPGPSSAPSGAPPAMSAPPASGNPASPGPTNTPAQIDLPESDYTFTLNTDERRIYDEYTKSLDTSILKDIPLPSLAKIYIQCGIDGNAEAEYKLYSPEGRIMTLEEYKKMNEEDMQSVDIKSRQGMADLIFPFLDEGEFVEDGNRGSLGFSDSDGMENKMYFIKNSNGMWEVKFNPFDDFKQ